MGKYLLVLVLAFFEELEAFSFRERVRTVLIMASWASLGEFQNFLFDIHLVRIQYC